MIRYDEPFHWWGPGWHAPPRRTLIDLLRDETIDPASAAILWAAIACRRSVLVIGGPSGLGKSTLLSALTCFLPCGTRRLYLRGCFESFAFLEDHAVEPRRSVLLINEISPHLPVYLWGQAVDRALAAAQRGYPLMATAHAESVPHFVGSLTGSPLHIRAQRVAALEFVVLMEQTAAAASGSRVRGIWRLLATRDGLQMTELATTCKDYISHETSTTNSQPSPSPDIFQNYHLRRGVLEAFRDGHIQELPAVLE